MVLYRAFCVFMCVIYTAALGKEWDRVYAFERINQACEILRLRVCSQFKGTREKLKNTLNTHNACEGKR